MFSMQVSFDADCRYLPIKCNGNRYMRWGEESVLKSISKYAECLYPNLFYFWYMLLILKQGDVYENGGKQVVMMGAGLRIQSLLPFFGLLCNVINLSNPGISQWGSRYLFSSVQYIIKYYFLPFRELLVCFIKLLVLLQDRFWFYFWFWVKNFWFASGSFRKSEVFKIAIDSFLAVYIFFMEIVQSHGRFFV